jgi:hypothetical protein
MIAQLRTNMSTLRSHEKDMIIQYENAVEVSKSKDAWTKTLAQIQDGAKQLQACLPPKPTRQGGRSDGPPRQVQDRLPAGGQAARGDGLRLGPRGRRLHGRAAPEYDAAQAQIEALAAGLDSAASAGSKRLEATATLVMTLLAASMGLALLIITPLTLLNMKSICGPIRDGRAAADAMPRAT